MSNPIHDLVALMTESTFFEVLHVVLRLPLWLAASGGDLEKVPILDYKC